MSSHRSHTATSPDTALPKASPGLASILLSTTGPIKTSTNAKLYLKQRSLIAIEDNYNLNMLAHLLIMTSLGPKIPNHPTNVMRSVALLIVSQCQSTFAKEITVAISDKILDPTNQVLSQLKCEKDFLNALCTDQSKHTQKLHKAFEAASASTLLKQNTVRCYSDLKLNILTRNCIRSLCSQDLCK